MERSAKVPGTDGEKMSKSYDNTIEIFEEPGSVRKKVMRIITDSRPIEEPKDPDTDHLFQLYSLFVDDGRREEMADLYGAVGLVTARSRRSWPGWPSSISTRLANRRELASDHERVGISWPTAPSRASQSLGGVAAGQSRLRNCLDLAMGTWRARWDGPRPLSSE